jgi:hypothetical protein
MVFLRNDIKVAQTSASPDFESVYVKLIVNKKPVHIFSCYKPPNKEEGNELQFLEFLENQLFLLNPEEDTFIIGDLNMNLLNDDGTNLKRFLLENNLKNSVSEPTRCCVYQSEKNENIRITRTLLDVVLHNNEAIHSTAVIGCPFSDHKFVCTNLKFEKEQFKADAYYARNLSVANLEEINQLIASSDFSCVDTCDNVDHAWQLIKSKIIEIIDVVAPLKQVRSKKKDLFPWADAELLKAKQLRDYLYNCYKCSKAIDDHNLYKEQRRMFQSLNRKKMILFFASKGIKDFKNSKLFWKFYSASIRIKSDCFNSALPML